MPISYLKINSENKDVLLKNKDLCLQMYNLFQSYRWSEFFSRSNSSTYDSFYRSISYLIDNARFYKTTFYLAKDGNKLLSSIEGRILPIQSKKNCDEFYINYIFSNSKFIKKNYGLKVLLRALADIRVNHKNIILVKCDAVNPITNSIFKRAVGAKSIKMNKLDENKSKKILRKVGPKNKIVTYKGKDIDKLSPEIHIIRKEKQEVKKNKILKKIKKFVSRKFNLK